jgi:RNA polymerase sigma-70 factor (ECF subfamily)
MTTGSSKVAEADAELAARLMARDELALREAIRIYGGIVNGMARKMLKEPALAEEVVQDTFLAIWRRPGAFDPARGSLKTFLASIARNKAIDLVRKEAAATRTKEAVLREFTSEANHLTFESDVEARSEVTGALFQIPEPQRRAIALAYFGGRTYREVAQELRVPEGTIKTRMRDGLIKLRRVLSETTKDIDDG